MKWVFIFVCVSHFCSSGPPAVQGNGKYYNSRTLCAHAARHDPFRPYMAGRVAVCVEREPPQ